MDVETLLDIPFEIDREAFEELGPEVGDLAAAEEHVKNNRFILQAINRELFQDPQGKRYFSLLSQVVFHRSRGFRFTSAELEIRFSPDSASIRKFYPEEIVEPTDILASPENGGGFEIRRRRSGESAGPAEEFEFHCRPMIYGSGTGLNTAWWTFEETSAKEGLAHKCPLYVLVEGVESPTFEATISVHATVEDEATSKESPLCVQFRLEDPAGQVEFSRLETETEGNGNPTEAPGRVADGIDLTIRVEIEQTGAIIYTLNSPNGAVDHHDEKFIGLDLVGDIEQYRQHLMEKIEKLQRGLDRDGTPLLQEKTKKKIERLGQSLYKKLFPSGLRQAYRKFRERVKTIQITSDEPWIPWEMIRPYDNDDLNDVIDDDFLCMRFELTRWLSGPVTAPAILDLGRIVYAEVSQPHQGEELPMATKERAVIEAFGARLGAEVKILEDATADDLEAALGEGDLGVVHVASHSEFDQNFPDDSRLIMMKGRAFTPDDLQGDLQTAIHRARPLVFLNACQTGQQAWALTGLGGWAKTWVVDCHAGAFIGPQWAVRDSVAFVFAKTFYDRLAAGETLGQAASQARAAAREHGPGRPGWLAFQVYGHPNLSVPFSKRYINVQSRYPKSGRPGAREASSGMESQEG